MRSTPGLDATNTFTIEGGAIEAGVYLCQIPLRLPKALHKRRERFQVEHLSAPCSYSDIRLPKILEQRQTL